MRTLRYAEAIRESIAQLMASDERVFVIGQGLWSPWYVGNSMTDLDKEFSRDRVIDSPVCENTTTGAGIGAALCGMRPILVHPRMDFMLLAMDPIVNQAANWSYMFGGLVSVPLVIRPIINRGGEQGAQHSQALQSFFVHVPGLKVVMPSTPYDVKGLLISSVYDGNPVMYIDDRWLYDEEGCVPEDMYQVPIGSGAVRCDGADVTVVSYSHMAAESARAAVELRDEGISAAVIDLRTLKPWDKELVLESVAKTGRLLVVDGCWATGGVGAEIVATVATAGFGLLKDAPLRVGLPDAPAPTSGALEKAYYPDYRTVMEAVKIAIGAKPRPERHIPSAEVPGQIVLS